MSSVDVIVPCYRYGHFLKECVESVLAQPGPSIRVLIIDDASPDNTAQVAAELAQRDHRVTFIRHAENRGHIATYNEGIEWTRGDYVLLLSADDYLLPGAFQRASALLDRHPNVTFVFGAAVVLSCELQKTRISPTWPSKQDIVVTGLEFIAKSRSDNLVFAATAIVRRTVLMRVGGYRSDLPHCADMELWFRLAATGDVGYIPGPQGVYRLHNANMSLAYINTFLPDLKERSSVLKLFFSRFRHPASGRLYRRARRSLGRCSVQCASAAYENGAAACSRELMQYAHTCSVTSVISIEYLKFTLKRFVGLRAAAVLRALTGRKRTVWG
jgi:glycosyltransferase involved in cell wall biosynthesis